MVLVGMFYDDEQVADLIFSANSSLGWLETSKLIAKTIKHPAHSHWFGIASCHRKEPPWRPVSLRDFFVQTHQFWMGRCSNQKHQQDANVWQWNSTPTWQPGLYQTSQVASSFSSPPVFVVDGRYCLLSSVCVGATFSMKSPCLVWITSIEVNDSRKQLVTPSSHSWPGLLGTAGRRRGKTDARGGQRSHFLVRGGLDSGGICVLALI